MWVRTTQNGKPAYRCCPVDEPVSLVSFYWHLFDVWHVYDIWTISFWNAGAFNDILALGLSMFFGEGFCKTSWWSLCLNAVLLFCNTQLSLSESGLSGAADIMYLSRGTWVRFSSPLHTWIYRFSDGSDDRQPKISRLKADYVSVVSLCPRPLNAGVSWSMHWQQQQSY